MRLLAILLFCLIKFGAKAQPYRFDNKAFQNVFPETLCRVLNENPDHILVDVRSPGEYADTSGFDGANIGRLKNAININVNELPKRWHELEAYKNKAVFLYCSHSQRSRRASKILADSGFTRVYNINGGMSRLLSEKDRPGSCLGDWYQSNAPYKLVTALTVMQRAEKQNPYFIIDTRPDSLYSGKTSRESLNHIGRLKQAHHIEAGKILSALAKIPKNKPLLIVDASGETSMATARLLAENGFTQLEVLYDGMNGWIEAEGLFTQPSAIKRISESDLKIAGPAAFIEWLSGGKALLIDVRPQDQFQNQSESKWQNLGNIRGAVNIPATEWKDGQLLSDKKTPILVYGLSSSDDVFFSASQIRRLGFKNVYVLWGGLWGFRRNANNLSGRESWNDWVVNIPEENN